MQRGSLSEKRVGHVHFEMAAGCRGTHGLDCALSAAGQSTSNRRWDRSMTGRRQAMGLSHISSPNGLRERVESGPGFRGRRARASARERRRFETARHDVRNAGARLEVLEDGRNGHTSALKDPCTAHFAGNALHRGTLRPVKRYTGLSNLMERHGLEMVLANTTAQGHEQRHRSEDGWGMLERVALLRERSLPVPHANPNPRVTIQNAAVGAA